MMYCRHVDADLSKSDDVVSNSRRRCVNKTAPSNVSCATDLLQSARLDSLREPSYLFGIKHGARGACVCNSAHAHAFGRVWARAQVSVCVCVCACLSACLSVCLSMRIRAR